MFIHNCNYQLLLLCLYGVCALPAYKYCFSLLNGTIEKAINIGLKIRKTTEILCLIWFVWSLN